MSNQYKRHRSHPSLRTTSKGANLTEFGIVVGLIAVFTIGSVLTLGNEIQKQFFDTAQTVADGSDLETSTAAGEPVEPETPLPTFTGSFAGPIAADAAPQFSIENTLAGDVVALSVQLNQDAPTTLAPITLSSDTQTLTFPLPETASGTLMVNASITRGTQTGTTAPVTAPILSFSVTPQRDIFIVGDTNTATIPEALSGDQITIYTSLNNGTETDQGGGTLPADAAPIGIPLGGATSGNLDVRFSLTRNGILLDDDISFSNPIYGESFYNFGNTVTSNIGLAVSANFNDIFTYTYNYQFQHGLTSFDKYTGAVNWHVSLPYGNNIEYANVVSNDTYVATHLQAGPLTIHNASNGAIIQTFTPTNYIRGLAFDPDNPNILLAISRGNHIEKVDINTGLYIRYNPISNEVAQISIHNGRAYVISNNDNQVRALDMNNLNTILATSTVAAEGTVRQLETDGTHLYTLSTNGRVCRFDLVTLQRPESCQTMGAGSINPTENADTFFIHNNIIYISQGIGSGIRTFQWNSTPGADLVLQEIINKTGAEAYATTTFGSRYFVDNDGLYIGHSYASPGSVQTGGVWFLP